MKTQHLRKSCKLFLTASKCDICYAPLKVNCLLAVSALLLTACYLVFRYAQTALGLWHALLILFAASAAMLHLTKQFFFQSNPEELTIVLPDHEVNWRQGTYVLDNASRLSFWGFWLVLSDKTEIAVSTPKSHSQVELVELFIFRHQLNYHQICYLSYLIKAAQKHR